LTGAAESSLRWPGARLGVLVSGTGTNLGALIEACASGRLDAEVALVASNKANAPALQLARDAGIAARAFTIPDHGGNVADRDAAMSAALRDAGVDLVICAGYDRVLDDGLVWDFKDRILNLHPSLLPAFGGGMRAVADAFDAGVKVTGVTIHLIEPRTLDGGPIVAQEAVMIEDSDTLESLTERIHAVEHRLLVEVVERWVAGRYRRCGNRILTAPPEPDPAAGWIALPPRPQAALRGAR
jgi:phosphoribosylglycinamide formyltransferase-1